MDKFKDFFDLAAHKKEGRDYCIVTHEVQGSTVAIVAPHGAIERGTAEMAQAIAADDYNLYVFKSILETGGDWPEMHVTSTHFNEPRCLELVAKSDVTVTIHECRYPEPVVCLGGVDKNLELKLAAAFNAASIKALTSGHHYKALSPDNICNKNRKKQGVQLEFGRGICNDSALRDKCVRIVRDVLKALTP